MLTEKKLAEIRARLDQAQFGYGKIGGAEYCADVGALLAEIERLKEEVEAKVEKKPLKK